MTRSVRITLSLVLLGALSTAFGCAERRIYVTSVPEGATVIINDVNVGQTPVEVDFLYYGRYDVRLSKDGYEPILTSERIKAPLWDWPGFDVVAAAVPGKEKKQVYWHYELTPAETNPDALIERAATLRERLSGTTVAQQPATEGATADKPIVIDEMSDVETSTEELPPVVPEPEEEGEGGGDGDQDGSR